MKRFLCVMAVALGGVIAHAQVPEIYELIPRAARAGEVLRLIGQDFHPFSASNTVHVGGVKARILSSWVTELEVEVPAAAQPGPVTVTVSGRIATSPMPFQPIFAPFGGTNLYYARVAFVPLVYTNSLPISDSLAAADLDGDGNVELIMAMGDQHLRVFDYVPTGSHLATNALQELFSLSIPPNLFLASIHAVDLDADGRIDLITDLVTAPDSDQSYLFKNIHSGGRLGPASFAGRQIAMTHTQFLQVAFGDMDRDGYLDLIAGDRSGISFYRNLLGQGATSSIFGVGQRITPPSISRFGGLAVGDLDHDGHLDIATSGNQKLTIYSHNWRSGEPTPRFTQFDLPVTNASHIHIGDIQGDGLPEIISIADSNRLHVQWNQNEGTRISPEDFQQITLFPRETELARRALIDLNGDALPELLTTRSNFVNESAALGGIIFAGTYLSRTTNSWSYLSRDAIAIVPADMNADGTLDIVIQNRAGLHVFQNISGLSPAIGEIAVVPGQQLRLTLVGCPNEIVTLQSSSDFQSWAKVPDQKIGLAGSVTYQISSAASHRFFRIVAPIP